MDWNAKYRPNNLDEYIGQDYIKEKMRILSEQVWEGSTDLPNILFSGEHGTGKTSMVYAFLKHTFGTKWKYNFHEINSSSQGNIDMIRTSIRDWCTNQTLWSYETPNGETRDIPYTIIFLDEADGLTYQAQFALRRTMEDYPNVRFFLSCNFIHKVIRPIQDRAMRFHFSPYRSEDIFKMLSKISTEESIKIGENEIKLISENCGGSARKAQKLLQKSSLTRNEKITEDDVRKSFESPEEEFDVGILLRLIEANASHDIKLYSNVQDEFGTMLWNLQEKGISGEDVIRIIYDSIKSSDVDLNVKKYLTKNLGETLYKGHFVNDIYLYIELWARSLGE